MKFILSRHAEEEAERRRIPRTWLEEILENPQQRLPQPGGKEILQSRLESEDGRMYLVRAVVAVDRDPPVVVTVIPNEQDSEVLEAGMRVSYDPEVDVLSIFLSEAVLSDAPVEESDPVGLNGGDKPGVILDYDKDGNVTGLEILDASRRMGNPMSVEYAIARRGV